MFQIVKLEIFLPETYLEQIRLALQSADAGHIGRYDSVMAYSRVRGCWRAGPGAEPFIGKIGELCEADEVKVEVCCRADRLSETIAAVRAAHPYEEPVINVIPLMDISNT